MRDKRWGLFKSHRTKPEKPAWTPVPMQIPRQTAEEAQRDLDELAQRAGWKEQP